MNTKTHLKNTKEQVIEALSSEKEVLVKEFASILRICSDVLNIEKLLFWEDLLKENGWESLLITKSAVSEQLIFWRNYEPSLKTLSASLQKTCEKVFLYWEEDDLCDMQGQFYYYKFKETNQVFKESEYGNLIGVSKELIQKSEISIALIPDLAYSSLLNIDFHDSLYY
ncbi:hypothetical protein [Aureibacter tunicatorum]|uniref:Uncharacterized protein n=1 Tax=Aureibacter tunicatorum TaxID=866807 RepID=A0AAE3XRZ2_9BACT|nr:hypothetical protein [Aureibacter tunicatorum]MDR6240944.1 hypothetical protein [Aureibacter tunicatorum]BDD03724.1 hypothetical protein AUTU_12070 [Aureibacter tunicatorum]